MTYCLPPNLLALFAPREQIPFLQPPVKLSHEKKRDHQGGIAEFVHLFESPYETPAKVDVETKDDRQERVAGEKARVNENRVKDYLDAGLYDPNDIHDATTDPFKTLFVSRLNFDTSDSKLRREFEYYGPIRKIRIIYDLNEKPRGYAFIEYEHERDMRSAYKHADGKKIDGRRVLVDVERARTVEGWLPRRLGGGLGNTRRLMLPKWKRELGMTVDSLKRPDSADRRAAPGTTSSATPAPRVPREREREREKDRDRDRDRGEKDKERERKRSRSKDREEKKEPKDREKEREKEPKEKDKEKEKERKRSRSKERKRKRSRSRGEEEKKRSKRSRSKERKRKREKGSPRGDKDKEKDRDNKTTAPHNAHAHSPHGNDNNSPSMQQHHLKGEREEEYQEHMQMPVQHNGNGYSGGGGGFNPKPEPPSP